MQKNPYPGKFIVFEGLDGSGQSTQAALLRDYLTDNGLAVVLTKEPTKESQASREIRETLDKKIKITPQALQELFVQDRREHLDNLVIPALKEGKVVISDRYFFSTFAYGVANGLDLEWLMKINDDFLIPDMTFISKTSPETCVRRIEKRGISKTLFEELKKLTNVWQTYEILPQRIANTYLIDGEKTINEVSQEVKSYVHSKLNL
jgi:dTMP kinase